MAETSSYVLTTERNSGGGSSIETSVVKTVFTRVGNEEMIEEDIDGTSSVAESSDKKANPSVVIKLILTERSLM